MTNYVLLRHRNGAIYGELSKLTVERVPDFMQNFRMSYQQIKIRYKTPEFFSSFLSIIILCNRYSVVN